MHKYQFHEAKIGLQMYACHSCVRLAAIFGHGKGSVFSKIARDMTPISRHDI